ncbi:hypothetical protein Chor_011071 [Crotalus horridus]
MAGVSFSANRLELLASYQEVIGEDSPTDCSFSHVGALQMYGYYLLIPMQLGDRKDYRKDMTFVSEAEANPVLCFELDLPLFLLLYCNVFEAAHIISNIDCRRTASSCHLLLGHEFHTHFWRGRW